MGNLKMYVIWLWRFLTVMWNSLYFQVWIILNIEYELKIIKIYKRNMNVDNRQWIKRIRLQLYLLKYFQFYLLILLIDYLEMISIWLERWLAPQSSWRLPRHGWRRIGANNIPSQPLLILILSSTRRFGTKFLFRSRDIS